MLSSDWILDVCSSDLRPRTDPHRPPADPVDPRRARAACTAQPDRSVGPGEPQPGDPALLAARCRRGRDRDRRDIFAAARRERTPTRTARAGRRKRTRGRTGGDRQSTRLTPVPNAHLVYRLLLTYNNFYFEKKQM